MNLLIALLTARALILVSFTDDVRFHFAVFFFIAPSELTPDVDRVLLRREERYHVNHVKCIGDRLLPSSASPRRVLTTTS